MLNLENSNYVFGFLVTSRNKGAQFEGGSFFLEVNLNEIMMYEVKQLGDLDADFFDSDEGHENDGFQNVEIHTPLEDTPIKEEEKSKSKETPSNTPASNAGVIEKLLKRIK